MSLILPVNGRGAFTATGKDNLSKYYEFLVGKPMDGASATRDANYLGVNLGVKAIQERINALGYEPALATDGVLGKASQAGIKWVQAHLGLTADGQAGPNTCKALWRDLIAWFSGANNVPAKHLWGMVSYESRFDPGAVGYTTPADRGLAQINLQAHPAISAEQAHDPVFALKYSAERLAAARAKYAGKGVDLQTKCSIAQHNAPTWASQWYTNGVPPNDRIVAYVNNVLLQASTYK